MADPTTTLTRGAFSLGCRVDINVHASAERIWAVLTDAKGFPRWNSTVTGIDGEIRDGGPRFRCMSRGQTANLTANRGHENTVSA
jgi:uncharacterized protein YndB with AHSA1/START domain